MKKNIIAILNHCVQHDDPKSNTDFVTLAKIPGGSSRCSLMAQSDSNLLERCVTGKTQTMSA